MTGKNSMNRRKAWLIVLVSLLDDIAVLALIFLGLWVFHVEITWALILIIALVMAAVIFIIHKTIVPSLLRKKLTGAEGMMGMTGRVTEPLLPRGRVKIKDEYWKASSVEGEIGLGEEVEVVGIAGLSLEVRKKTP
jgi:membrane-bound serine protease (ClpP class)